MSDISSKENKTAAGVTGATSGTLMVVVANTLPNDNPIKSWLLLVTPSVSVFIGVAAIWLQKKFANWIRRRELESSILQLREKLNKALENPDLTKARRSELTKRLEQLEELEFRWYEKQITNIEVVSDKDILERLNDARGLSGI